MKITYAITCCTEFLEIQRLMHFLLQHKRPQDNIVVLFDEANGDPEIETFLRTHSVNGEFAWHKANFDRNFSNWKNKLNSLCSGDFIFNIDADEIPSQTLVEYLHELLEQNPEIDVYRVPRINTVDGITPEHIQKWGWQVNEKGWVNFPDYQMRIYRNTPEIQWTKPVHEILDGFKTWTALPDHEMFSLNHPKTIERQEKQNNLYNQL